MIDQDFQKWFDELSQKREREKRYKEISDRVIKLENEMICEISRIENLKGENTIGRNVSQRAKTTIKNKRS
ncbi:MAG TPA: hypothetical protein PK398_02905 [Candidatus Gracilibacteria bacterium]|nr:hypothetical protein [Candidatus Gracilibacteria bacterium]